MRVEVTFVHTPTKATRVVTVRARSIAEGVTGARVLLYTELEDRKVWLTWGVANVRKLES